MRTLATLLCSLALIFAWDGGDRLLWAAPVALSPGGSVSLPAPEPTEQVISVGEEVTGTLDSCCPAVFERLFELTAPSDGTLIVHLSSGVGVLLGLEDVYWSPMWRFPRVFSTVATLQVTAGQTYRLSVSTQPWDLYGPLPFVLMTSIESGPVTLPPACELAPPGSNWVCVNGGWVPDDHPLAVVNAPGSPPPPPAPEGPPVGGFGSCPTVQPVETWVCVNGNWVPRDHPLALSAAPGPTPPSPPAPVPTAPSPPAPQTGCTTPDPFASIPGLIGLCVDGGWVPIGHPQAPEVPDVSGTYTLTITTEGAAGSCVPGFPEELKQPRVYTARVEQAGFNLTISLSGADFTASTFSGTVRSTDDISFALRPASRWDYDGEDVTERLSDGRSLCVAGTIDARSTLTGISGTVNGAFGGTVYVCSGSYTVHSGCPIDRFEMVRR